MRFELDPKTAAMTVGDILRSKMDERGIDIPELVSRTGVNRATIYGILKDERSITAHTAIQFEKVFQYTAMEWLLCQAFYDLCKQRHIDILIEKGFEFNKAKQLFYNNRRKIIKDCAKDEEQGLLI